MSLRKDQTCYSASFRNFKLFAWGFDQVIKESFIITIYQECCKPQRWAARPQMSRHGRQWRGPSAEEVMRMVESDFEEKLTDWFVVPDAKAPSPSLRSGADVSPDRRRA